MAFKPGLFGLAFFILCFSLTPHTLSRLHNDEVDFNSGGGGGRAHITFTNSTMHTGFCDVLYKDMEHIVTPKLTCDDKPVLSSKSDMACDLALVYTPMLARSMPCFNRTHCDDKTCTYDCIVETKVETRITNAVVLPVGARHDPFFFNSTTIPWKVDKFKAPLACGYVLADGDPTKLIHLQFLTSFDLGYVWQQYFVGPLVVSAGLAALVALMC